MTRTKKTLGRNWTRYHNYYGMTHILEKACTKVLHWSKQIIQEYIVNHAHEVNHEMAMKYTNNPPPLPDNGDDNWYKKHPKLQGSGNSPHKQLSSKQLRKKGTAQGGVKTLLADQQGKPKKRRSWHSGPARNPVVPEVH